MKKLLLTTAAVALGAVAFSGAADAQGVKLGVGGHMKAYGVWHSQDSQYNVKNRSVDILRTTEVHFSGETTLDNGLTVGAHVEMLVGGNRWADVDGMDRRAVQVDESYLYMSGAWGRVNVGNEDGAAYLLQVAAPSADSNIDGIRQFINPFNASGIDNGAGALGTGGATPDYNALFFAGAFNHYGLNIDRGAGTGLQDFGTNMADIMGANLAAVVTANANSYASGTAFAGLAADEFNFYTTALGAGIVSPGDLQTQVNRRLNVLAEQTAEFARKTDYAQDMVRGDDKLTYLTPVFQGFQAGVSWTPLVEGDTRSFGVRTEEGRYKHAWDFGARYEGQFDQIGLTLGGGYSYANLENDHTITVANGLAEYNVFVASELAGATVQEVTLFDEINLGNRKAWNLGGNVGWTAFNLGVAYKRDNMGIRQDADNRQWVVGGDYTTGPFKLGVSYLNEKQDLDFALNPTASSDLKTERWSGGLTYTYGPGMTFRGSIHHMDHSGSAIRSSDSTSFLLGTQINF